MADSGQAFAREDGWDQQSPFKSNRRGFSPAIIDNGNGNFSATLKSIETLKSISPSEKIYLQ
jgi:hypothetical protein